MLAIGDGERRESHARLRIDTPQEAEYYRHGAILRCALRSRVRG